MLKGIIRHPKFALKVIFVQEAAFRQKGLVRVAKVIIVQIISCLYRPSSFLLPFLAVSAIIVLERATHIPDNVFLGLTVQRLVAVLAFCVKLGVNVPNGE
jgi:hypothetical protein